MCGHKGACCNELVIEGAFQLKGDVLIELTEANMKSVLEDIRVSPEEDPLNRAGRMIFAQGTCCHGEPLMRMSVQPLPCPSGGCAAAMVRKHRDATRILGFPLPTTGMCIAMKRLPEDFGSTS